LFFLPPGFFFLTLGFFFLASSLLSFGALLFGGTNKTTVGEFPSGANLLSVFLLLLRDDLLNGLDVCSQLVEGRNIGERGLVHFLQQLRDYCVCVLKVVRVGV
ncbi:MAG: hypothetical protein ABIG44_05345, partial [Planctomycetota bacterium]